MLVQAGGHDWSWRSVCVCVCVGAGVWAEDTSVPAIRATRLVDAINDTSSEQFWASLQNIDFLLK